MECSVQINNSTTIKSVALSSFGGSAFFWIYYVDVNNAPQLIRININNKTDYVPAPSVPSGLTTLVPLTTGDGVALLGNAVVRGARTEWSTIRECDKWEKTIG
jgi:hypothetical protein